MVFIALNLTYSKIDIYFSLNVPPLCALFLYFLVHFCFIFDAFFGIFIFIICAALVMIHELIDMIILYFNILGQERKIIGISFIVHKGKTP